MRNKKGFTLVELLVVITIIGLLVVIAVPASMTISKKVKEKMYDSKIELIEKEAILWGQENKNSGFGINCNAVSYGLAGISDTEQVDITKCGFKLIHELIEANALEPDIPFDKLTDSQKEASATKAGIITNPTTNESMNRCIVVIYIKHNRVYAKFGQNYNNPSDNKSCMKIS